MQTITSKAMAKVAAVATGLALATSMLSLAPIAHAATCSFTGDLTIGSTGMEVTCLQQALIAAGYSIPAGATGYFGTQTRAAVASWQSAMNIAPAVGYFGPISRAAFALSGGSTSLVPGCTSTVGFSSTTGASCASSVSYPAGCTSSVGFSPTTGVACSSSTSYPAGCTSSVGFSPTTGVACSSGVTGGSLSGSGRLTNVSSLGDVTSDLDEGDATTAVVGVSADATGGDVAIQRVDVEFTIANSGGSSNLNKYVSDVSLWLGSTKLASMDPALGDKDGRVWTLRFSGLNGVITNSTTGNIYVKVTPVESIGADEDGDVITVELNADSVRAVGADGISDTYVVAGTITGQTFSVSSATAGTLTVTAAGDNPTASQIAVSSSTTTGVKLLSFNMKAKNTNIVITDLAVNVGTSDDNLNDVINTLYLMKGSTVIKTKTVTTGANATTTFSDVNQTISKDDTQNFTIVADLKGDSAYADGTTLVASTTIYGWDVSDADGATVSPSAAAVGNTQTLTATGISVVRGTPSNTVATGLTTAGDIATMVIPFTVTAGDNDVFIVATLTKGASGSAGVAYATTTTSTQGATGEPTANLSVSNTVTGDSAGSYYKVLAGTSRTFTLTVAITATTTGSVTAGFVGMQINSIEYGLTSSGDSFYSSNLDTFKTEDKYVTER